MVEQSSCFVSLHITEQACKKTAAFFFSQPDNKNYARGFGFIHT